MSIASSYKQLTIKEARKILGTTAKDMSDNDISLLIKQVDALTDIVVAHTSGSIIKSDIDYSEDGAHNGS